MLLTPYRRNDDLFDPFRELDLMERAFFGEPELKHQERYIRTDIREKDGNYVLEAELPGFKKEDIDIEVNDGYLTISAENKTEHDEKDQKGNFIMRERRYGSFKRTYDTAGIDTENMKASFENGVLTLTMPKLIEVKPEVKHLQIEG